MARSPLIAWTFLCLSLVAWGGFAYMINMLSSERLAYADAYVIAQQESERGELLTRLRATIQSTEVERAALESLTSVTILQAVQTIEAAGKTAGATNVVIGGATPVSNPPKGLAVYSVALTAQGTFVALMRTVSMFEKLPIPSTVEQFEISKGEKAWNLTARLQVTITQ